jgi:hypothetical protein
VVDDPHERGGRSLSDRGLLAGVFAVVAAPGETGLSSAGGCWSLRDVPLPRRWLATAALAFGLVVLLGAPGGAGGAGPVHRVNVGGPALAATPGWSEDSQASPSPFVNTAASGNTTSSRAVAIDMTHPSLPVGTPAALFQTERYDAAGGAEMQWTFPVAAGKYEVRLYFAETYGPAQKIGGRVFNVSIEGSLVLDHYDIYLDVGGNKGVMKSFVVDSDGSLDIAFQHVVENPAVSGIEIVPVTTSTIAFTKSVVAGTSLTKVTSLQFGPDGRLYAAQQNGLIKAFTIVRNGPRSYAVASSEAIGLIQSIPNHNDDGTVNSSVANRQVTGILVAGTAAAPVVYVTSSDPRIGGGSSGSNTGLDTNSGVLSRLSRSGGTWQRLDLVRGLPRSEEAHSTNGMQFDAATNTLFIAQGGHTNKGAPSHSFALLSEYALSGAVLKVDLNAITSTYDLPTLNDPAIDSRDPFGGDFGKNQAKLVAGAPVQVFAPGFRNPYDVVLTKSGRMYTVDNGAGAGWGDVPVGEGPAGSCTNAVNEPGTTDVDTLHRLSPGYYGGHPNPTRGNKANVFNGQSPVTTANAIECDYRAPGANGSLTTFSTSTNGLVEYTSTKFAAAMAGDLLAASFDNNLYRIKLNATGDIVALNEVLFSTVGSGYPLDVTTQGDGGAFPGTIWVGDHGNGNVYVFEPVDGSSCAGTNTTSLDEDGDGYSNADEIDNQTDPCSAADYPPDWDQDHISNLNDSDDDNDGRPDRSDPFAIDAQNGAGTNIPVKYTWDSGDPNPGGLLGLGFTGLMSNGTADYESLFDPANMTAGGAPGLLGIDSVPAGDALGASNNQQYGFQFGVATASSGVFTAHTRIVSPFGGITPQGGQSMGLFIGTGDQDNYIKLVTTANGGSGGVQFLKEVAGTVSSRPTAAVALPGPDAVDLYLTIDRTASTVQPRYAVTTGGVAGPLQPIGGPEPIPAAWLASTIGLAVGVISTSAGGPTFAASWDVIEVTPGDPAASILLNLPTNGSTTANPKPVFSGTASTAPGDSPTITIKIYPGTTAAGTPVQVLSATRSTTGSYAVSPTAPLPLGTFTARAEQPVTYAADSFGRTVAPGTSWGPADTGGTWSARFTTSGTAYSVGNGVGKIARTAATGNYGQLLPPAPHPDVTSVARAAWDTPAAGAAFVPLTLISRFTNSLNYYQARLIQTTGGALQVQIVKTVNGVNTSIAGPAQVSASYTPGTFWRLRSEAVGQTLRVRAWSDASAEPSTWSVSTTDTTFAQAGSVGIQTQAYAGATATPTVSYDDYNAGRVALSNANTFTIAPIARDAFGRSVAGGTTWGTADVGGSWSARFTTSGTAYSVGGGVAKIVKQASGTYGQVLAAASAADVDERIRVAWDKPATGTGALIPLTLLARFQNSLNHYQGRLIQTPAGSVQVQIVKTVGGTNTSLAGPIQIAASSPAGAFWWLRLQVSGTTLRIRAWQDGTSEPGTWSSTATDGAPLPTGAVGVAAQSYAGSTATPTISYDDYDVVASP